MKQLDEKTATKLGEVLAFTQLGAEIFQKGQESLSKVLGEVLVEKTLDGLKEHETQIKVWVKEDELSGLVHKKSDSTMKKLKSMQDLYLDDQWDDATEILEWLGFFEGAAIVHWSLVGKKAKLLTLPSLATFCESVVLFHRELFITISLKIK